MTHITISLEQARRFLVRRQSFVANGSSFKGPDGVTQAINHLEAVQIDPLCAFERNQHQVLYNRVQGYRPDWLDQLLYLRNGAFEYYCNALCVLPIADYPYFRHEWQRQQVGVAARVGVEMLGAMREVLQHVSVRGGASSRNFDSGRRVSGWWDDANRKPRTKIEKQALDYLHLTGELLISGRAGNQRSYDLPERLVPNRLFQQEIGRATARRLLMLKFLRAYGLSQLGIFRFGWSSEPKAGRKQLLHELIDEGLVAPVSIEGARRTYYCPMELTTDLENASSIPEGQAAVILAPLDNLLWDRDRLDDLWGFNYRWEVYTPVAKRRYGHYVVPVMLGENFVGRIELKADKAEDRLRVNHFWVLPGREDALPTVHRAVELEASYLGLERVSWTI